jgi:Tol biopolymer transport system component
MLLFSGNAIHFSAYGRGAAVSPIENRVAYIASKGLTLAKPDGSYPKTVSNLPAFLGLFKEEPWDGPVWSPRGERVWFSTIIDEGGNMNLYLLDVRDGKKRRIVRHSQMRIIAWR